MSGVKYKWGLMKMEIYKCFDLPLIGKMLRAWVIKHEGGEKTSSSLRKYCRTKKVSIGMHTYGSCFQNGFNTGGEVIIGRYCSFGPSVRYFGANHPIEKAIMSPYFYNKAFGELDVTDVERSTLIIGNDVWVGANVIITSGCKRIGNGAVIAAGAVVTKDVAPYMIVGGNPAHIIKSRFEKKTEILLEKSKWWNYEPEELFRFYHHMNVPEEFAEELIRYSQKLT